MILEPIYKTIVAFDQAMKSIFTGLLVWTTFNLIFTKKFRSIRIRINIIKCHAKTHKVKPIEKKVK